MSSLNQQVTFKLGHSIQHLHCHLTGSTGQVYAAKCKTMNPNAAICQRFNGRTHVHRIPAKSVEFRHDQHITFLHLEK
ncbi:hypothetical protein WT55_30325 [Burkholderia pseudomultivorans]|nr:hypothetical protein WT55_30325 [Burkholderia pseudomultivorans]